MIDLIMSAYSITQANQRQSFQIEPMDAEWKCDARDVLTRSEQAE